MYQNWAPSIETCSHCRHGARRAPRV